MKYAMSLLAVAALVALASSDRNHAEYGLPLVAGASPERGKEAIVRYGCGSCHTIPGIRDADGLVGPPLTRIGSRTYVAGVLVNTPSNMSRWIQNPPGVDPLTAMPNLHVSDEEIQDIVSYLYTLR